jgi:hypothetical protein
MDYFAIFEHVKCLLLLLGFTLRRIQPFSVLTLQIMQERVSMLHVRYTIAEIILISEFWYMAQHRSNLFLICIK